MHFDLIRAWKDQIFRQHLSEKQPLAYPGDKIELSDPQLTEVCGGFSCSNGGNSDLNNGSNSDLNNDGGLGGGLGDLGSGLGNFGSGLGNFGS